MYFQNVKVGDKVWDYVYGEGKVVGICVFREGAISVNYCCAGSNLEQEYDFSGREKDSKWENINQRLFYYDDRPVIIIKANDEMLEQFINFTRLFEENRLLKQSIKKLKQMSHKVRMVGESSYDGKVFVQSKKHILSHEQWVEGYNKHKYGDVGKLLQIRIGEPPGDSKCSSCDNECKILNMRVDSCNEYKETK